MLPRLSCSRTRTSDPSGATASRAAGSRFVWKRGITGSAARDAQECRVSGAFYSDRAIVAERDLVASAEWHGIVPPRYTPALADILLIDVEFKEGGPMRSVVLAIITLGLATVCAATVVAQRDSPNPGRAQPPHP